MNVHDFDLFECLKKRPWFLDNNERFVKALYEHHPHYYTAMRVTPDVYDELKDLNLKGKTFEQLHDICWASITYLREGDFRRAGEKLGLCHEAIRRRVYQAHDMDVFPDMEKYKPKPDKPKSRSTSYQFFHDRKAWEREIESTINLYQKYGNCAKVAREVGVSKSCVQDRVKKHFSRLTAATAVPADVVRPNRSTHQEIVAAVSKISKTSKEQLLTDCKSRYLVHWRNIIFYLCREHTVLSLKEQGRLFNRHHTSILHAIRSVEKKPDFYASDIARVEALL